MNDKFNMDYNELVINLQDNPVKAPKGFASQVANNIAKSRVSSTSNSWIIPTSRDWILCSCLAFCFIFIIAKNKNIDFELQDDDYSIDSIFIQEQEYGVSQLFYNGDDI